MGKGVSEFCDDEVVVWSGTPNKEVYWRQYQRSFMSVFWVGFVMFAGVDASWWYDYGFKAMPMVIFTGSILIYLGLIIEGSRLCPIEPREVYTITNYRVIATSNDSESLDVAVKYSDIVNIKVSKIQSNCGNIDITPSFKSLAPRVFLSSIADPYKIVSLINELRSDDSSNKAQTHR